MELRQIRQFSRLNGVNRNPTIDEHLGVPRWNNNIGYFEFLRLTNNTEQYDGLVKRGSLAEGINYVWKLDDNKVPDWRPELYLTTVAKSSSTNDAIFTMSDGTELILPLGALAWSDTAFVTSVFGRTGDVVAESGDYTASMVTGAFDKGVDSLGDISEGDGSYHFTTTYKSFIDTLILNNIDQITDIGSGQIITDAERALLHSLSLNIDETIMDVVAGFIPDSTFIKWIYDDVNDSLVANLDTTALSTDDIQEGITNLYFTEERARRVIMITLPAADSVANRILGATEGVDYPTGWVLTVGISDKDLLITHGLDKYIHNIVVYAKDGSNQERILPPFSKAYSGFIAPDKNSVLIEALSDVNFPIRIDIELV